VRKFKGENNDSNTSCCYLKSYFPEKIEQGQCDNRNRLKIDRANFARQKTIIKSGSTRPDEMKQRSTICRKGKTTDKGPDGKFQRLTLSLVLTASLVSQFFSREFCGK
jgi:hypothetical protein